MGVLTQGILLLVPVGDWVSVWGAGPLQYSGTKFSSKVSADAFLKDRKVVVVSVCLGFVCFLSSIWIFLMQTKGFLSTSFP